MGKDKTNKIVNNYARLHDGYAYTVTLKNGGALRLHDHGDLDSVFAKWGYAKKEDTLLQFTGASDSVDAVTEAGRTDIIYAKDGISKPDGAGLVAPSEIASIAYLAPWDQEEDEDEGDEGDEGGEGEQDNEETEAFNMGVKAGLAGEAPIPEPAGAVTQFPTEDDGDEDEGDSDAD